MRRVIARALAHYDGREPYDADKYIELLVRATQTVLAPLGIDDQQVERWVVEGLGKEQSRNHLSSTTTAYWGPLFEFAERASQRKPR